MTGFDNGIDETVLKCLQGSYMFTLGDQPELRYRQAREALEKLGHETTIDYLAEAAALVREETGICSRLITSIKRRTAQYEGR